MDKYPCDNASDCCTSYIHYTQEAKGEKLNQAKNFKQLLNIDLILRLCTHQHFWADSLSQP